MGKFIRDSAHLIRPAAVILAGLLIFLVIRLAVIPKQFGLYGHYRPGALEQVRSHPIAYAGQQQCATCHDDQAQVRAAGKHARVACEACHAAKPQWFPQVVSSEHSSGMACNTCHKPHNPKI